MSIPAPSPSLPFGALLLAACATACAPAAPPERPTVTVERTPAERRDEPSAQPSNVLSAPEIPVLEAALGAMTRDRPDRPKLLRKLAERYVALESAALGDASNADVKGDAIGRAKAAAIANDARAAAIRTYTLLANDYPSYCDRPADASNPGCGDEVLAYLAHEHEQAGDREGARKAYQRIIMSWPQSVFVPTAYVAFGDGFFEEAQRDPSRMALAEAAYRKVLEYPPPANKVWGYAQYKLAWVLWNKGDLAQALAAMKKVIEHAAAPGSPPAASSLARAARKDIVPIYAVVGDPKKAADFLRPLSGDAAGLFAMMIALGESYLDTGNRGAAVRVYVDLLDRGLAPASKTCDVVARLDAALAGGGVPAPSSAALAAARGTCR